MTKTQLLQQPEVLRAAHPQEQQHDLLTVREVAKELRVDTTCVRRWIKLGALKAITLPTRRGGKRTGYRIKRTTLETILNGCEG